MGNTKPKKLVTAFTMRADAAFLNDLDDLRAIERPVLPRAEYLRKLVRDAKAAHERREAKRK